MKKVSRWEKISCDSHLQIKIRARCLHCHKFLKTPKICRECIIEYLIEKYRGTQMKPTLNISHDEKTYDLTPYIKNSTSGGRALDGVVRFAKSENTRYIKLPFIRLIFRDGKYVGFYHPRLRKVLK